MSINSIYPYMYKLPTWVTPTVAALKSAAGQTSTTIYRQGIYVQYVAQGISGEVLAQSFEQQFEALLRQPVELSASEGKSITRVLCVAHRYVRGISTRQAVETVPYEYVSHFSHVRIVYTAALRAKALRAVARAFR